MSDNYSGTATSGELARNLGTGAAESRSASFGAGVLGTDHVTTSAGLASAAQRYDQHVNRHYVESGVEQMTQNVNSALSFGLNNADPRSGVFRGERYVQTSPNARSTSTSEASPVFEQDDL